MATSTIIGYRKDEFDDNKGIRNKGNEISVSKNDSTIETIYTNFVKRSEEVLDDYFKSLSRVPMHYTFIMQLEEITVEYKNKYYMLGSVCQFEDTVDNRIKMQTKYLEVRDTPKEAIPIEYVELSLCNSTLKFDKIVVNTVDNTLILDMCTVTMEQQNRILELIDKKAESVNTMIDTLRMDSLYELNRLREEINGSVENKEERDVYNENINTINILIQKKVIQHKEYIHTNALYYKTEFLNTRYTLYDLDILSLD